MWFKGISFIFLFLTVCFLTGDLFLSFLNWRRTILASLVWGFTVLLACVQVVAYPMYRLNLSYQLFLFVFTGVLILLTGVSLYSAVKRKGLSPYSQSFTVFSNGIKKAPFLFTALCVSLLIFLVYTFAFYYPTTDDGYYMTRSMEVIAQNKMAINVRTAWLGWSNGEVPDYTDASTFTFLLSYISSVSGIHVTIMSKTFFAFCLVLLHFSAILVTADTVIEKRENLFEKKCALLILYMVFQIFSVKASSAGIWMTGYIWNGKSMLPGFIFPMILAACITLMKHIETLKMREWLALAVILLAGICFSIVGLNLPVILYFIFGLSFLISDRFRHIKKILPGAIFSVLPVLIIIVLSYLFVVTGQNDYYESGTSTSIIWSEQFLEAVDFFQFILYLLSVIYIAFRGSSLQKAMFVYAPVLLMISFLNPFLARYVCAYVTTSLVYWRLWWLLPIYLVPALVITDILSIVSKGNLQAGFFCSLTSLFLISGYQIFRYAVTAPDYTIIPFIQNVGRLINVRPELRYNLYGINPATHAIAKAIIEDWKEPEKPRVLMYFNRPFELRQYSTDILMVPGIRDVQITDKPIPKTDLTEKQFMNSYSNLEDGQLLQSILSNYNINYVCFDGQPGISNPEEYGFSFVCHSGGIDLWKVTD